MSIKEIPNTQWKYLIVDEGGQVEGTNNSTVAKEHALSSVVIETATCKVIDDQYVARNIPEQTLYHL